MLLTTWRVRGAEALPLLNRTAARSPQIGTSGAESTATLHFLRGLDECVEASARRVTTAGW